MEKYDHLLQDSFEENDDDVDDVKDRALELVSREVDLTRAERLLERLEALDTLTEQDKREAQIVSDELKTLEGLFKKEKVPVPDKLMYVIGELRMLRMGATRSIREEYFHKEARLGSVTDVLAEAGQLELELTEQQAARTLFSNSEEFQKRINEILPKLDALVIGKDEDVRAMVESQRTMLRKFLRLAQMR